jgi:hypothetical protein
MYYSDVDVTRPALRIPLKVLASQVYMRPVKLRCCDSQ